jgi:hypothetical protein
MKPVLARAVTKRRLGITARSRIAWMLSAACMAALLGACGEESPGASSPTSSASTSPTKTVAPSPKKSVDPSPPTSLDKDVRQAIVRYTQDRATVIVEAKVDPTQLSQGGTSFHGYFDAPSSTDGFGIGRFWTWKALFPIGVQEARQFSVFNPASRLYGCGPLGLGRGVVPTATVNREHGIIKAAFPSRCISEQGVEIPPRSIRASVNLDPLGSPQEGGVGRAHFTDPLFPGDVAVQRR